jgi:energy-coupling factor transport system substrate-specific component
MTHADRPAPAPVPATLARLPWLTPSRLLLTVASLVGLAGFLYPFVLPTITQGVATDQARASEAPLLVAIVTGFAIAAALVAMSEDQVGASRSRVVALLGVLVAIDATLRLVPTVLGASPIFLLIMLVGTVFGASFGFQMGALTILLSAVLTGGIGPWLPYQMLAAAWIGLTAGWLPRGGSQTRRLVVLAVFGGVWGLLFGALMNLWFWPFGAPGAGEVGSLYWAPGLPLSETVERYARFYLVTSLGFDLFRAAGNVVLVLVLGGPILRLLERYRRRFSWQPWEEMERVTGGHAE